MWPTICALLVLQGGRVNDLPGQRLSWERPLDAPLLLSAALTHLRAELSRISLCQGCILLLYFLTLLCSFGSLCSLSPHMPTFTSTGIWIVACMLTETCPCIATKTYCRTTPLALQTHIWSTHTPLFVLWSNPNVQPNDLSLLGLSNQCSDSRSQQIFNIYISSINAFRILESDLKSNILATHFDKSTQLNVI